MRQSYATLIKQCECVTFYKSAIGYLRYSTINTVLQYTAIRDFQHGAIKIYVEQFIKSTAMIAFDCEPREC